MNYNFNLCRICGQSFTGDTHQCIPQTIGTIQFLPGTTEWVPAKGWECPRCNRINAPWVPHCSCKKEKASDIKSAGP